MNDKALILKITNTEILLKKENDENFASSTENILIPLENSSNIEATLAITTTTVQPAITSERFTFAPLDKTESTVSTTSEHFTFVPLEATNDNKFIHDQKSIEDTTSSSSTPFTFIALATDAYKPTTSFTLDNHTQFETSNTAFTLVPHESITDVKKTETYDMSHISSVTKNDATSAYVTNDIPEINAGASTTEYYIETFTNDKEVVVDDLEGTLSHAFKSTEFPHSSFKPDNDLKDTTTTVESALETNREQATSESSYSSHDSLEGSTSDFKNLFIERHTTTSNYETTITAKNSKSNHLFYYLLINAIKNIRKNSRDDLSNASESLEHKHEADATAGDNLREDGCVLL